MPLWRNNPQYEQSPNVRRQKQLHWIGKQDVRQLCPSDMQLAYPIRQTQPFLRLARDERDQVVINATLALLKSDGLSDRFCSHDIDTALNGRTNGYFLRGNIYDHRINITLNGS